MKVVLHHSFGLEPCFLSGSYNKSGLSCEPGWAVDITIILIQLLGFKDANFWNLKYDIVNRFSPVENSSQPSTMGNIYSGHSDITPPYMTLTEGRHSRFRNLGLITYNRLVFIFKTEDRRSVRWSILDKISLLIILFFSIPFISVKLISSIVPFWWRGNPIIKSYLQKASKRTRRLFDFLTAIFLSYTATMVVLTFNAVPQGDNKFNSIGDIAAALITGDAIGLTSSELYAEEYLSSNPVGGPASKDPIVNDSIDGCMNLILADNSPYIYLGDEDYLIEITPRYCGFSYIYAHDMFAPQSFTAYISDRLYSRNIQTLNEGSRTVLNSELRRLQQKYTKRNANCDETPNRRNSKRLDLSQIQSLFLLVSMGLVLCIPIFILENIYARIYEKFGSYPVTTTGMLNGQT